jgi:cyclic-di-AMP phosphodiesterase PgpH
MKKILGFIVANFDMIYILALFGISFSFVVFIFPGEGKFKYEYHRDHPWHHKDLIAPFDFAIYKLEDELAAEKKEALQSFAPIYTKDPKIGKQQIERFNKDFEMRLKNWKAEYDSLKRLKLHTKSVIYNPDSVKYYAAKATKILESIYQKGIFEYNETIENPDSVPEMIRVITNKIATEISYHSVFSIKSAYTFFIESLNNTNGKKINPNVEFIKGMQMNLYLLPNMDLDKETTLKAKKDLLDGISATKGIVIEGERIISRGEMIDLEKLRKLESLKKEFTLSSDSKTSRTLFIVGRLIIVLFAFMLVYLFLQRFRDYVLESRRKTFFILLLIVSFTFITDMVHNTGIISIYLIPFIIVPILVTTFYETRLALFIHLITVTLAGFYAPNSFEFLFIQFFAGIVAIIGMKRIQKRGQFFKASLLAVFSYFVLYFGFATNQSGDFKSIEWMNFAWFGANGILVLLSFPLVYVFEKTFNFVSDLTLMELSDTNQKLLRELAEKAPGTFQHSIQVANLAEEVIRTIGGNPLLVRTGALYHDIGKLSNPQYFTENQLSGTNPHDAIGLTESAAIIINHVTFGYDLAKKAKLPSVIIDFILTHHGTLKAEYFFRLYKKEFPDNELAWAQFSYPGPKPFSKETAVLMIADSIEAASRSLKQFDAHTLSELVDNIVSFQTKEQQFDNSPITLAEINEAKKIIKKKLNNIYHARIEYPKP